VTDLLAGAVTTGKSSDPDDTVLRNNMLSIFIAPAVYDPEGGVLREAARFVEFVKASPPLKPGETVKAPGDVERATRQQRLAKGIPIDDTTWADLKSAALSVGIDETRASAMIA
jgi:hydroxycarboxylate dehydrogenase B